MALDPAANFVRDSTDASIDTTSTTLSVSDASIFPDPASEGEYNIVVWAPSYPRPDQDPDVEIMRVTARDTTNDDLTVTRGQEGTSGASHPSGSAVQLSPTAKMFGDIASRYTAAGEDFDGQGTSVFSNLQSVSTGEINNVTSIDRDATDWGAAVNAAVADMNAGETLFVPPVDYGHATKAVIDKPINILSFGRFGPDLGGKNLDKDKPTITKTADVPFLETGDNIPCSVEGLRFESDGTDTTGGLIFHGKARVEHVGFLEIGGHGVYLHQASDADNLNSSTVSKVAGNRVRGDLVRIENTSSSARDVNAIETSEISSFQSSGFAVNMVSGFGNVIKVQAVQGGNHTGGVRINGTDSYVRATYFEGNINQGIVLDGTQNTAEIIQSGLTYEDTFIDNGGNNQLRNIGKATQNNPNVEQTSGPYSIGGGDAEVEGAGKGLVVTTPDGSAKYQIRVDNSGNVTTEQR